MGFPMTTNEASSEEAATQDRKASPRAWLKPLLLVLSILGGLALNGLITGLVCHFTVTVPIVRAIDKARLSSEANVAAKAIELGAVVRSIAPKPAPALEPVTAVQEPPPAAGVAPVTPAHPSPAPSPGPPGAGMVPAPPVRVFPGSVREGVG
jgi:hypothetical protein